MKKYLLIILVAFIITVIISALFFTKPGADLISKLPYTGELYTKAALTINSPNSASVVIIDGEDYGTTPIELTDLSPGEHTIVMTRETATEENFYQPRTFYLDLQPNTEAILNIEIGPDDNLSGHILFYSPTPSNEGVGLMTISATPEDALVEIDGELLSELPISAKEYPTGNHTLVVEKEGYESIEFPIIITEGYNLNITAYLMPIPINIDSSSGGSE